jgi:hypothetical protein
MVCHGLPNVFYKRAKVGSEMFLKGL